MKSLVALRIGWKLLIANQRMWTIFYLSNIVFALLVAIPFRNWLSQAAGHTRTLAGSIGQFDFAFLLEILRNHKGFSLLCSQASVIAVAYLVLSAFLIGGVLHVFIHQREKFVTSTYMAGGATYFWSLLRLAGYFLVIQIAVLAILFGILTILGLNPKVIESDVQYVRTLKIIGVCYLFIAIVIAVIHDYIKIHLVRDSIPMRKAFASGMRFVWRHFGSVLFLYVINLLFMVGLFLVYLLLRKWIPSISSAGILLGFLLSQCFVAGRIGVKLLILSSANALIQLKTATGDLMTD